MSARILRLVLFLCLLLPGPKPVVRGAGTDPIDQPYKIYLPFVQAGPGNESCQVVYQSPPDDTMFPKTAAFDARWTVRNTSQAAWRASTVTIRFVSGDRLHTGADARDLPVDVLPDGLLDTIVDMNAPGVAGSYTSNWALMDGATRLCAFYVQIRVQ